MPAGYYQRYLIGVILHAAVLDSTLLADITPVQGGLVAPRIIEKNINELWAEEFKPTKDAAPAPIYPHLSKRH